MKALVFDLDDTLLNKAKEIGPRTRRALDAWLASGRRIVIATSRPIRMVKAFLPPEFYSRCEIITMNGVVRHSSGVRVHLAPAISLAARQIAERYPYGDDVRVTLEFFGEHFTSNIQWSEEELWTRNAATPDMFTDWKQVQYEQVTKVAINGMGKPLNGLLPWLSGMDVEPISCEDGTFINVVALGVDKATALEPWLQGMSLGRADFAVFGDDLPDVKAMALSDHAVAMDNAKPDVKAVAHHVIGHCDEDAIGPYIEQWL